MKIRWFVVVAVAIAACALATGRAHAAATCTIASATMPFGNYDVYGGAWPSSTTLTASCSGGQNPNPLATMNALHGTIADRYMICVSGACLGAFSTDQLHYNLYTDASHSTIWGATGQPSAPANCKNASCTWTVYGLIPAAVSGGTNDVAVGGYSDSITVTINY